MEPQSSNAPQPSAASLPPLAPAEVLPATPQGSGAVPGQPRSTTPAAAEQDIKLQVRQLTEQYKNDPYTLSRELTRLKSAYIANKFHVIESPVGN